MIRRVLAAAIVALALVAAPGVSHAAPAAPLPPGVASNAASGHIIQAWCGWRCRHWRSYHYWRWYHCGRWRCL